MFSCYWAGSDPYNGTRFETLIASLCFMTARIQSYKYVRIPYVHAKYFPRCLSMRKTTDPCILEKKFRSSRWSLSRLLVIWVLHLFKVTYSVLKRFSMVVMYQWVSFSTFKDQKHLSAQDCTDKCWNVINFEKLIVSLNIFVDYQFPIAFVLLVLITFLANRVQTYYERKPCIA